MIKNIRKYSFIVSLAITAIVATGCSDQFLEDKNMYGSFNGTTIYENYVAVDNRIAYLYRNMLPESMGGMEGMSSANAALSTGTDDMFAKSTEEYGGLTEFIDPTIVFDSKSTSRLPDIFNVDNNYSPWKRIRETNDIIAGVLDSKTLTDNEKKLLLGQAYFFRAWRYYLLVKEFGGVPIIKVVQNPVIGDSEGVDLVVPRSSTKDCIDFIVNDLAEAARCLPARWPNNASDFGRITAGTALALKGRIELMYASPLFNRADKAERWTAAYETNKEALKILAEGNFGLAYENDPGTNAANWAKIFSDFTGSDGTGISEAVFVTLYNNVAHVDPLQADKWNDWERTIRPSNAMGSGGKQPTAEIVDLFPMADGKHPNNDAGMYTYNKDLFFLNRDPRFYRTFAFPGVEWRFKSEDLASFGEKGQIAYGINGYTNGSGYKLWNYCWYDKEDDRANPTARGYAADVLGSKNQGIYLRKRTDDLAINPNTLYIFEEPVGSSYKRCGAPYMEIRYAEVLLNFAEAAAGANKLTDAFDALVRIRKRVGYTDENGGLDPAIKGDRAKLLAAILYERQVELAFEGKRFFDMRRWMLFDGGVGQEALNPSWKLTGYGGNTCTYLGVAPTNGKKDHYIEIFCKGFIAEKKNNEYNNDGTIKTAFDQLWNQRPAALALTEDPTTNSDGTYKNAKMEALVRFYQDNLKRKDIVADGNDDAVLPTFKPQYYILGIKENSMQNNVNLVQNIGWGDYWQGGADGTFDPLAE